MFKGSSSNVYCHIETAGDSSYLTCNKIRLCLFTEHDVYYTGGWTLKKLMQLYLQFLKEKGYQAS